MKNYFKIAFALLLTAALSGMLLSLANMMAKDKIEENQRKAVEEGIRLIEPTAQSIDEIESGIFELKRDDLKIGYAFLTQGQGYQGPIKILCGVNSEFTSILGIEIIESTETPGLGARINEDWFKNQFAKIDVRTSISYTKGKAKGSSEVEAITGATVSSKAVVDILNRAVKELREKLK